MENQKKTPRCIRVMYVTFAITMVLFSLFLLSNRHSSPVDNSKINDTMSQTNLAVLLSIFALYWVMVVSYVMSFGLSAWNAIGWLDRGGKYFWVSASVFFSDAAILIWLLPH